MIGQSISHYKVLEKIGEGGMGAVYRALDSRLDRIVALKVLPADRMADPDRQRRFVQEAKAASSLNHPNIITIYEIGTAEIEGQVVSYIAMEFVVGQTLHELIGRKGLPVNVTLKYAVQIADALTVAHSAGIVHRDLKPGNIMVTEKGLIKVLDFGLAKLTEWADPNALTATIDMTPRTLEGMVVGTAAYMSPEQAEGKKVDARSDIFSFGSVLYEMVTGRRAFQAETHISTLAAVLNKEPNPVSGIVQTPPRDLEKIILRCLRKEPERRIQHMDEVKLVLEDLIDESTTGRAAAWRWRNGGRGRRSLIAGIVAGLVLAVAIGGGLWWWSSRTGAPVGQPVLTRLTSDSGLSAYPALSPDGKLLAYASDRGGEGSLDLWIQQMGGGEPIRLTRHEADDYEPAFSPDATRIAFRSDRGGGGIYLISALGGEPRLMAQHGRRPVFSPDGKRILYWMGGDFGKLFMVDSTGGPPRPVQPDFVNTRYPVWSPDGKRILFHGIRDPKVQTVESGDWWVAPADGGPAVKTGALGILLRQGLSPPIGGGRIFSPSLWTAENEVIFSASLGDTTNLWKISLSADSEATGPAQRLSLGTGLEVQPSMATGRGGGMVFANLTLNIDVWSVPVEANQSRVIGEMERLTRDPAADTQAAVSADGKRLAFISTRSGNRDVWVKDLPGGRETAVTITAANETSPTLTNDGSRVAFSRSEADRESSIYAAALGPQGPTGVAEKLCDSCGGVQSLSADGRGLTYGYFPPARVGFLSLAAGERVELLGHPEHNVWGGKLSPDDRWIVFNVTSSPIHSRVYIAPFAGRPVGVDQWVAVTDEGSWDDKPRWSPDGKSVYFISERDGFRCIWSQRLDAATKRPIGEPSGILHLHSTRLSMTNVEMGPLSIYVARDKVVFSAGELTGNIWMAKAEADR